MASCIVEDVAQCMNVVPSLFFRPTFDLTDPATFEEVMSMTSEMSLQEEVVRGGVWI